MNEELLVKYEGHVADSNMLPAYEGSLSIQGVSRSITLVATYIGTGKVRKNAPFESPVSVFLRPARPGSFETIYQVVSDPNVQFVAGNIVIGVTASFFHDAIKVIFNRVTGRDSKPKHASLRELERKRGGDIAALEDAVEPALIHAHRIIGAGSNNIVIFGDNNQIVFDHQTKEYITTSIDDNRLESKDVSVASYNANTKSGRVYDFDFERTVPFALAHEASNRSAVAIANCLTQYTRGEDSKVAITFKKVLAPDGKVKKFIITKAKRSKREL
jgi:hypothetical protein